MIVLLSYLKWINRKLKTIILQKFLTKKNQKKPLK